MGLLLSFRERARTFSYYANNENGRLFADPLLRDERAGDGRRNACAADSRSAAWHDGKRGARAAEGNRAVCAPGVACAGSLENQRPDLSHILIGFAKEEKLRYITAVARKDQEAKPVSYREIGNLEKARQAGDAKIKLFNYQWTLPPENDEPETLVIALGRDPERLDTWALRRLGEKGSEEQD